MRLLYNALEFISNGDSSLLTSTKPFRLLENVMSVTTGGMFSSGMLGTVR